MKWIRLPHGDKAHAVVAGETLCGLGLVNAVIVPAPGFEDRCGNCDNEWRRRGRAARPHQKPRQDPKMSYQPRFKLED